MGKLQFKEFFTTSKHEELLCGEFLNESIDYSPFKLNPHLGKKNEVFHTARKSMLKLVKLPSLGEKYCKIRKIYACEVCKFCIFLYCARKALPQNGRNSPEVVSLFRTLQYFSTKLGNFTNFNMLFLEKGYCSENSCLHYCFRMSWTVLMFKDLLEVQETTSIQSLATVPQLRQKHLFARSSPFHQKFHQTSKKVSKQEIDNKY